MAKSGTFVSNKYSDNYSMIFDWVTASQDVASNSTTVDWTLSIRANNQYGASSTADETYYDSVNVYVDGNLYEFKLTEDWSIAGGETKVLASGSTVVYHQSTSYQTFTFSWDTNWSLELDTDNVNFGWSVSVQTATLDYITRAAYIVSAPSSFTDEESPTITYKNPAGTYADTLQLAISIDGTNDNISYRDISKTGASYTFTFTEAELSTFYSLLDAGLTSATVRFWLKSTVPVLEGTTTETVIDELKATLVFVNYLPTLDPVAEDVNANTLRVTGDSQILVRYMSNVVVNMNDAAHKGASVTSKYVSNGDTTYTTSTSTFNGVTSNTFYFGVTDNRNHTTRDFLVYNIDEGKFIEYVKPTCNIKNDPLDSNGNVNVYVTGKYYEGFFGALDNSLTVEYLIYKSDDTETDTWISLGKVTPEVDENNNYSYSFTISGLEYTSRYELYVRVYDELTTSASTMDNTILAAEPLFDWGPEDFQFYIPVGIQGGECLGAHTLHNYPSSGVIELSEEIRNFKYLEIFYTDNNGRGFGVTKVPVSLDSAGEAVTMTVDLSIVEASSATSTYIRRTAYICSGMKLSPATTSAGYVLLSGTSVSHTTGTNYIRIIKVLGYK